MRGRRSPTHPCQASGCTAQIIHWKSFCEQHWAQIPGWLKKRIYEAGVYGFKNRCHPTDEYLGDCRLAIAIINKNRAAA